MCYIVSMHHIDLEQLDKVYPNIHKNFGNAIPFPHIIYTSKNINNIFSNYNSEHQYYSLCHETNVININNIIRCIIYCDHFSNIQNNTFKFKNVVSVDIVDNLLFVFQY